MTIKEIVNTRGAVLGYGGLEGMNITITNRQDMSDCIEDKGAFMPLEYRPILTIDGIAMHRLVDKVSTIGYDYDSTFDEHLMWVVQEAEKFGKVHTFMSSSGKGWHIEIRPEKPVTLLRSFEIRYHLGDDYHRLCRDMLKAMHGFKVIDVLFDKKVLKRERIFD